MPASFFFYDLETTGISPKADRIMQFAGQRTTLDFKPVGEPFDLKIKLSLDILPTPTAVLISGLSPLANQKTGLSEAEFSAIFSSQIVQPQTIFIGFNNVRFDDEFMRYLNYRNFYDPYSWHWQNGSSRWDLLDVVRMTRALRPAGINWPFNEEGKPINRLEYLTKANKLAHYQAHDALSDSLATMEVARLLYKAQPKLFNYLLGLRQKQTLIKLIESSPALVYTSAHYPSDILHTTVVVTLNFDSALGSIQAYDLRYNPRDFMKLSIEQLCELWRYDPDRQRPALPLKTIKLNRCPALAPLSVLDKECLTRLKLNMRQINSHLKYLKEHRQEFAGKLQAVTKKLDQERTERFSQTTTKIWADERLYERFILKADADQLVNARQQANSPAAASIHFQDSRLNELYDIYRARNYPKSLNSNEESAWRAYVKDKLFSGQPSRYQCFIAEIKELEAAHTKNSRKLKLLKELHDYGLAILNDYGRD